MKSTRRFLIVPCLVILTACAGCFSVPASGDGNPFGGTETSARCIEPEDSARLEDQVVQLVNLERAEFGLPPVVTNDSLKELAATYACRMIENGFFGHEDQETGEGPGDRAVGAKYSFFAIGENLAAGQETAAEAMQVWMDSPAHRSNILDPKWKEIGIAVREGGEFSIYWVQEFGDPSDE